MHHLSKEELEDALRRSGYLLESRVYSALLGKKFYVDANVAYPDPTTGKSRELDLYAMTVESAGPEEFDHAFLVLLIECMNNPQPVAFFTKEILADYLEIYQIRLAGLPIKILEKGKGDQWRSLSDWLDMDRYHHYCRGRVATQFCSFTKKRGQEAEWMATHLEDQFDAFRKLCVAVEHYRRKHLESWTFGHHENVNIEIYYPVLVVQGQMIEVRPRKGSFTTASTDHVRFRQSMWSGTEAEEYSIDVITERYLPSFLRLVTGEFQRSARLLRRRHKDVRRSIDRIVRMGRRLKSPRKIRELLDF